MEGKCEGCRSCSHAAETTLSGLFRSPVRAANELVLVQLDEIADTMLLLIWKKRIFICSFKVIYYYIKNNLLLIATRLSV